MFNTPPKSIIPKTKQSKFYVYGIDKLIFKICLGFTAVFFLVGIYQSTSPIPVIEPIKPDLSNFSKEKPVSILLNQETINPNVEFKFTDSGCKRSTCTDIKYEYFLIRIFNRAYILETQLGSTVKPGETVNIVNTSSEGASKNKQNIIDSVNNYLDKTKYRLTSQEKSEIKIIKHFTMTDVTILNYWGWIWFATGVFLTYAYFSKYLWNKIRYEKGWLRPFEKLIVEKSHQQKANKHVKIVTSPTIETKKTRLNKGAYIQIAIFLGVFGVHNFLEKDYYLGLLHLMWLFSMIVSVSNFNQFNYVFWSSFLFLLITFITCLFEAFIRFRSSDLELDK